MIILYIVIQIKTNQKKFFSFTGTNRPPAKWARTVLITTAAIANQIGTINAG